ncbi:MAG: CotH kinase family protein [Erysipelotrichia bacterium]|nr:CotH kinase family protein [Erysipelotrichia bacterium]
MKRNTYEKPKKDIWLIITIAIALIVAVVLSVVFSKYNNQEVTIKDLPQQADTAISKLVINEVMTNNSGVYVNSNNEKSDYVELYNGTDKTIDLSGYGLSDKGDRVKWVIEEATIEPHGYVVISLTGKNEEGLNANFKLSSAGNERLILVNRSGKIIDGVDTVSLGKNQVMNRNSDGSWYVSQYATPGQENSQEGLGKYLQSLKYEEESELVINEILPKNDGNFLNENGLCEGYIELKNVSDHAINLNQYSLSNDKYVPFKKQLPDKELAAGEIFFLYANKENFLKENYCGFTFDGKNGSVILSKSGKIISEVDYQSLANGLALVRMDDGQYQRTNLISPGYENNNFGIESFQKQYLTNKKELLISEAMNNNYSYLAQNGNRYYDWLELYNNSSEEINLAEYCLSTSDDNLESYQLPEVILQPQEYIVFMASGDTALSNDSYYHTNFKLSDNEGVYLSKAGKITDCIYLANIPSGYSYGRNSERGFFYFSEPTPGYENYGGNAVISFTPEFLTDKGIYEDISTLDVVLHGYGNIYYTLDGSEPTTSSYIYDQPITLTSTTVVKSKSINSGEIASATVTSSYIINEHNSLPVLSLSMKGSNFTYLNNNSYEADLQLPCYIEFFDSGKGFSIPCSISCFGGNARGYDKKSYAIRFKGEYGAKNLKYKLFDNRDNAVYDSLVLRTGSNDWTRTIFRDAFSTGLSDDYLDTQASKACILYINGEYWGIYNIREKVNARFISDHYNVDPDTVSIVNVDFTQKCGTENISYLFTWAENHNLAIKENYDYICSKVDIVNLIDYWISEMYCVNPDVYNVRYFCSPEIDDGKWKYIYYDMDHGFRFYDVNYYTRYLCNPYGMTGWINNTYSNALPRRLFKNSDFVDLWLERLSYHLENTFNKERLNERLDQFIALYADEIERDRNRWAGSYDSVSGTYPSMRLYNQNIEVIRTFIDKRQDYILSQTKYYFGLSDSQMEEIFKELW